MHSGPTPRTDSHFMLKNNPIFEMVDTRCRYQAFTLDLKDIVKKDGKINGREKGYRLLAKMACK